jgi:hypothetical protein
MPPSAAQIANINAAVTSASSQVVRDAALALRTHHCPLNRWLGKNNHYATNTVSRIEADVAAGAAPRTEQLARYLAASVLIHCFDGWAFLSNSVDCLLDGDVGTSIHLAYYAELRSVMSFLASEGIGVFNRHHYWLDAAGNCHRLNGPGTHDLVWYGLRQWAAVPSKAGTLLGFFSVGTVSLDTWLNAGGHVLGPAAVAALASSTARL